MKKSAIFLIFWGCTASSIAVIAIFFLFTYQLGPHYLAAVGPLVHKDQAVNNALLYIFSQACALGCTGGALSAFQVIFAIAHSGEDWFSKNSSGAERLLIGFLMPIKGGIAGAIVGGLLGGAIFSVSGMDGLDHAHLLILGIAGTAGFSEQVLQRIMQYGVEHSKI